MLEVLEDTRQAHFGRLGDCLDDEGGRVHEAVVFDAVEDRICHRQIDDLLQIFLVFFKPLLVNALV